MRSIPVREGNRITSLTEAPRPVPASVCRDSNRHEPPCRIRPPMPFLVQPALRTAGRLEALPRNPCSSRNLIATRTETIEPKHPISGKRLVLKPPLLYTKVQPAKYVRYRTLLLILRLLRHRRYNHIESAERNKDARTFLQPPLGSAPVCRKPRIAMREHSWAYHPLTTIFRPRDFRLA